MKISSAKDSRIVWSLSPKCPVLSLEHEPNSLYLSIDWHFLCILIKLLTATSQPELGEIRMKSISAIICSLSLSFAHAATAASLTSNQATNVQTSAVTMAPQELSLFSLSTSPKNPSVLHFKMNSNFVTQSQFVVNDQISKRVYWKIPNFNQTSIMQLTPKNMNLSANYNAKQISQPLTAQQNSDQIENQTNSCSLSLKSPQQAQTFKALAANKSLALNPQSISNLHIKGFSYSNQSGLSISFQDSDVFEKLECTGKFIPTDLASLEKLFFGVIQFDKTTQAQNSGLEKIKLDLLSSPKLVVHTKKPLKLKPILTSQSANSNIPQLVVKKFKPKIDSLESGDGSASVESNATANPDSSGCELRSTKQDSTDLQLKEFESEPVVLSSFIESYNGVYNKAFSLIFKNQDQQKIELNCNSNQLDADFKKLVKTTTQSRITVSKPRSSPRQ